MFPIDMPQDIGSSQWVTWFSRQPPAIQNQVVSAIGLAQTNDSLPQSSSVGGYAPELTAQDYGLAAQNQAPFDLNTKGKLVPYDLNTAATTTNVLQDRNTYMIDNAAAMQAGPGAYAYNAFDPVSALQPDGNPLQSPGYQTISRYANSKGSGWESFIADLMLNQGMDPSAAAAELFRVVSAPETANATPEEKAQRQALINSLPGRSIKDPTDLLGQSYTMSVPDFSDPGKARNTVDWAKITEAGDKMFQQLASDPQAGYTDPRTGLPYAAPPDQTESTAAKWYRDRGLSLPTDKYSDPQYALAGYDQQAVDAWTQSQQQAQGAADQALNEFQGAQSSYDEMQKAWDAAMANPHQAPLFDKQIEATVHPGGMPNLFPAMQGTDAPWQGTPDQTLHHYRDMQRGEAPRGKGMDIRDALFGPPQVNGEMQGANPFLDGQTSPTLGSRTWDSVGQLPGAAGRSAAPVDPALTREQGGVGFLPGSTSGTGRQPGIPAGPSRQVGAPGSLTPGGYTGGQTPDALNYQPGMPIGQTSGTGSSFELPPEVVKAIVKMGPKFYTMPTVHTGADGGTALGANHISIQDLLGLNTKALTTRNRSMTQADLNTAKKNADTKRTANTQAIAARSNLQDAPDSVMQGLFGYMRAQNLAKSGRTPLGDQLAQRALAARAAGLYGYQ